MTTKVDLSAQAVYVPGAHDWPEVEKSGAEIHYSESGSLLAVRGSGRIQKRAKAKETAQKCVLCTQKRRFLVDKVLICRSHYFQWKALTQTPNVGIKINAARVALTLDISNVAKKIRQTPEIFESWEQGTDHPKLRILIKISDVLSKPLSYFFENRQEIGSSTSMALEDKESAVRGSLDESEQKASGETKTILDTTAAKCKVCGEHSFEEIEYVSVCKKHGAQWDATTALTIGQKVKKFRENKKYMQSAVAEVLGKSQAWVSHKESGKRAFKLCELEIIAHSLDTPLSSFF